MLERSLMSLMSLSTCTKPSAVWHQHRKLVTHDRIRNTIAPRKKEAILIMERITGTLLDQE